MNRTPIPVLYFTNSTVRGGAEEHLLTLVRRLDRNLFRPLLLCSPECAEKLQPDLPADVHLERLEYQWPYQIAPARRLARILHDHQVGILHSHLFTSSVAASPVGWLNRVPVILETPHLREAWRHGLIKGHYFIDRAVGKCVDHYIAVSQANADYLIQDKGLPPEKVHVIHNGCDLGKYGPERPTMSDLRQSLGFEEDDPIVVVLARLEPQKGHRILLAAHAQVVREMPTARLVCVGAGALALELQDQSRNLRIQDNVRFVGYQSNVADWLALADISVLPSLFEGLPLVAIESLAAQRPMVATAVDGTTEVVINERTGLTVPPENAPALAEAILRLLRQPDLSRRLAQAGRQWVLEHFTQEQQIRKTQELYLRAWDLSVRKAKPRAAVTNSGKSRDYLRTVAVEPPFDVSERQ